MQTMKLLLLLNTIKFLRIKQIRYRVFYLIRNRFYKKKYECHVDVSGGHLLWTHNLEKHVSYKRGNSFTFLNIEHNFGKKIDWNWASYGKLWTYNLNYFDFLNQSAYIKSDSLLLIRDYIDRFEELNAGLEAYPTSLRCMNWIKFVSAEKVQDDVINKSIYNQYLRLLDNLEYHILGNHLLENGFSLLFGAYYFQNELFYLRAKDIIEKELIEQILDDGAHFELSPMYHQIILERLLDCLWLIKLNSWKQDSVFVARLELYAVQMLSWLNKITFRNGNIPMVNDSASDIASSTSSLLNYSNKLGLKLLNTNLSDSGYRKYENEQYELFIDVGEIGPTYQPGHAHADTFSFILHSAIPIIVDPGITTYNIGKTRSFERSTNNHNTVSIEDKNSSEVWSGFRVGNRANVVVLEDNNGNVKAEHNGYKREFGSHKREFIMSESVVIIRDDIRKSLKGKASFHFHPDVKIDLNISTKEIRFTNGIISFINSIKIESLIYTFSDGFNKKRRATKIEVSFMGSLQTTIKLTS